MNTKVITISLLSLIGIGAFFYFKPKKSGQDKNSLTGGSLDSNSASTLGTTTAPTTTSNTTTAPTSTLSVPPTQTSVTIGEITLTTPVQVVETAIKIAEAKDIARQINELRNSYEAEKKKDTYNPALQTLFKNTKFGYPYRIKELNTSLALLGYTEVNGSIQKL